MRRILLTSLMIAACAGASHAQLLRRAPAGQVPVAAPPADLPPAEADIWPYPPPDPKSWWEDKRPKPAEAADPLAGRRIPRGQRLAAIDNGVDASTYRLWGLMPLQWQVLHQGEMILEVWVRPANSVRQAVSRVIVRRDGQAFVQGRAGLACCEAQITRRIGFDAELPAGSAQAFLALRSHPMWQAPRLVSVDEGGGASEGVCIDGVSYDVTLVVPGRSRSLHRACDEAEYGQVADALEPTLRAALGQDGRFDVLFPAGVNFAKARQAYQALLARGGALRPDPNGRAQPAAAPIGAEPAPQAEAATPPAVPQPAVPPPGPR
ncbi:hypothetical protein [Phenylobacterium soli]|uniref:hypothetical protein n=1 Tax=Phenylobacterium soli TaxID=2170551 RepID=UPI0018741EC6|nr:hypothetical protein [Phenylobacterium soli]